MKDFDALVLCHYDFTDKEGKVVKKTKYRVCLGKYGTEDICGPLDNTQDIMSEVHVELTYKDNKFRIVNVKK